MGVPSPDWRIRNQAAYLRGVQLERAMWTPTATSDHEHCEFCWAKFAAASLAPDALQDGYATLDRRHWACAPCFDDFQTDFEWASHEP